MKLGRRPDPQTPARRQARLDAFAEALRDHRGDVALTARSLCMTICMAEQHERQLRREGLL
jgi:hypothetical protein